MLQLTLRSIIALPMIVILHGISLGDGSCYSDEKPTTEKTRLIHRFDIDRNHRFDFDEDFAKNFGGSYGDPKEITDGKTGIRQRGMEAVFKKIDFEKQKVLIFNCHNVSSKVTAKLNTTKGGNPEVVFTYHIGSTKDLISHIHVYAIPKELDWDVVRKRK